MGWGIRRQQQQAPSPPPARFAAEQDGRGNKGKASAAAAFSFSPLSWIAKLTSRSSSSSSQRKGVTNANHAPAPAATTFPSCLPNRVDGAAAARHSPPRRSPTDVVPRRLSVGNDGADAAVARRLSHHRHRRRHCSLGGDRDNNLPPPLGHLIPFSFTASPPSHAAAAPPSDTDGAVTRHHRRRARHRRRHNTSLTGGRRSFSFAGRIQAVRIVRPPELERLAVVRRTRDPQRAFRESMVEMIASGGGGSMAARPEELERLLACYLALNADEHHECIVKVFRQVWFDYINLHLSRRRRARR
uniref:Transcription repressor n=1 Tax=Leersia perrieri TaxID=77586 RepID=A0A0D9WIP4_9ORYZ